MDISDQVGDVKDLSDPEDVVASESDGNFSVSSVDGDPHNGLDIACDLIQKFDQGIGPWLFEVLTCAFRHGEEETGSVHAYLIKREQIQARDNKKKSVRKALKHEDLMLTVMFELPKLFLPQGPVNPQFLEGLSHAFPAHDMRAFNETNDAAEHPANRAWILLIRDLHVETEYRRLGIAGNMIRKTIRTVLEACAQAGRPLLVAVQPKRTDEFSDEEWSQFREMVYHCRVNQRFWEKIGFKRLNGSMSGFTAPWYFWGTALSLPPKTTITIPNDIATRITRSSTPPPRARDPRTSKRRTPYDYFPEVHGQSVRSFLTPTNRTWSTLPPAPLKNDHAPGHDDAAADDIQGFDDPEDPSLPLEDAYLIKSMMVEMDKLGEKYRVRPLKEPVQAPVAESTSRQQNCPFKTPLRAIAPKPPAPTTFQAATASEPSQLPAARPSDRNQFSAPQPSSRFLVTYVLFHAFWQLFTLTDIELL